MKPIAVLAGALLVALFASSCREGGAPTTGLPGVKARRQLRVAMTGMYPPFNFFDEQNELSGFDVDIAREVATRLRVEPAIVTLRWDGILAGLLAGRYDVIVGSMAITEERQRAIDFSTPYYTSGAQAFKRRGSDVKDLAGAVVGVNLGTTYETMLRGRSELKQMRTYGGVPELLHDLAAGRLDAFVTDRLVGQHAAEKKGQPIEPFGPLLFEERMGIALKKGQPELKTALDLALASMREDGTYSRLGEKWFGAEWSKAP